MVGFKKVSFLEKRADVGGAKNVSSPVARRRRARGLSAWGSKIAAGVGSGGFRKMLKERIYLSVMLLSEWWN